MMPSIKTLIVVVGRYSAWGFAQLTQNSKKSEAEQTGERRMSSNRRRVSGRTLGIGLA
jgi:hypothetical protein